MGFLVSVSFAHSREIYLEPSANGYLILCLSDDLESVDDFELEVLSNQPIDYKPAASMFDKFSHHVTRHARWTAESSGGSSLEKTFTNNNFYLIDVKQPDTNMMVEISSQSNLKLSLNLIKTQKKALNQLDQREIDASFAPSECSAKYNSLFYDLGKNTGSYMVVPWNYTKEEGIYELKFSSTKPIEVSEGMQLSYQVRKDFALRMVNDPKYLSVTSQRSITMYILLTKNWRLLPN